MRELVKKQIDGITYEFGMFTPRKSIRMLTRLARILGGPFSMMFGKSDGTPIMERDITDDALSGAIQSLVTRLDEQEVENIIIEFMEQVNIIKKEGSAQSVNAKDAFDAHFMETGIAHLFKVLIESVKVQYSDFFVDGGGIAKFVRQGSRPTQA